VTARNGLQYRVVTYLQLSTDITCWCVLMQKAHSLNVAYKENLFSRLLLYWAVLELHAFWID